MATMVNITRPQIEAVRALATNDYARLIRPAGKGNPKIVSDIRRSNPITHEVEPAVVKWLTKNGLAQKTNESDKTRAVLGVSPAGQKLANKDLRELRKTSPDLRPTGIKSGPRPKGPKLKELILKDLVSFGYKGTTVAVLRPRLEKKIGRVVHDKTVGMTLYRWSLKSLTRHPVKDDESIWAPTPKAVAMFKTKTKKVKAAKAAKAEKSPVEQLAQAPAQSDSIPVNLESPEVIETPVAVPPVEASEPTLA